MYKLTKAYKIWREAPPDIQDVTTPLDFAIYGSREMKFLETEAFISHVWQHFKQYTHFRFGIPRTLNSFCSCDEFEEKGL
jgi:hypothetical protein